jgi:hypothetical protein
MNTKKKPEPVQEKYQQTKANSKRKAKRQQQPHERQQQFHEQERIETRMFD